MKRILFGMVLGLILGLIFRDLLQVCDRSPSK